ncbi:MAG: sigma-54-dependent Fis family transcriptional regulator [Phycisphaeraceae bacterium]|nr:sigma-54-dependent Fis family transcriptional regulator [Phycisphaeraceae bacterium]
MDRTQRLQLSLWRDACRHIDLGDSLSDLHATIDRSIGLERMWIFALEEGRCDLVATTGTDQPAPKHLKLKEDELDGLTRWIRRGGISPLHPTRPGRTLLRPLCPVLGTQPVICGALLREDEPEGIVAWRLRKTSDVDDDLTEMLSAILEPLAVALDTSRRFHQLEALKRAAEADREAALARLGRQTLDDSIVGVSRGLRGVMERVGLVSSSDVSVLILGETGSGKEVIARAVHDRSDRAPGPFIRVNCGAIPHELIDSQLFGHEKGSFTGATERRQGWFERADGGTLFLDEVAELSLAAQVRLLRVIQEGTLERVGGQDTIQVSCRIIAATHRDLAEMVRAGTFREDLWYRLAVFPLLIPPLRERREDLADLAVHFAARASVRFGLPKFEITPEDIAALADYPWPGNVRELAAVIDRAALLGKGHRLAIAAAMGSPVHASPLAGLASGSADLTASQSASLKAVVRAHIEAVLQRTLGRIEGPRGAAALLDINPHTLRSKMRKLGVAWKQYRS